MNAGVQAEYNPIKKVLMKKPGIEASIGALAPAAALFEGPLNTAEAQEEFDVLEQMLKVYTDEVFQVDNILMNSREGLEKLAKISLNNNYKNFNLKDKEQKMSRNNYIIDTLSDKDLFNIISLQPTITHGYNNQNTGFYSQVEINPVYNMMFLRDQQITTDKGIIIGNMNSQQRKSETRIMETVFDTLGVENVYNLQNGNKLEGGDFLPAGKRAFIGTGLRTEKGAVQEILDRKLVGYDEVVVVEDQYKNQQEMHLDTYFNIISEDKVALLESRINSSDPRKKLTAHIYSLDKDNNYQKVESIPFDTYLMEEGYKIIPITEQEQQAYGMNFLTLERNKVIGVNIAAKEELAKDIRNASNKYGFEIDPFIKETDFKKLGSEFKEKMIKNDVNYISTKFNMLNMMYGSVHCMTQVIERENMMNNMKAIQNKL